MCIFTNTLTVTCQRPHLPLFKFKLAMGCQKGQQVVPFLEAVHNIIFHHMGSSLQMKHLMDYIMLAALRDKNGSFGVIKAFTVAGWHTKIVLGSFSFRLFWRVHGVVRALFFHQTVWKWLTHFFNMTLCNCNINSNTAVNCFLLHHCPPLSHCQFLQWLFLLLYLIVKEWWQFIAILIFSFFLLLTVHSE